MRLLVAGSDRVDAGETSFSTGLVERIAGAGFGPRAGGDYWSDHAGAERSDPAAVADAHEVAFDAVVVAALD